MKILLASLLLIFAFQVSFGQEKSQARKIDEFGKITCEDLFARLDNFFNEIMKEPNSIGYAIIYKKKDNLSSSLSFEILINDHKDIRGINNSQFVILRGKENEDIQVELWKVPKEIELPFQETMWNFELPSLKKPKRILDGYAINHGLCYSGYKNIYTKHLAEILTANKNLNANIVISAKNSKLFNKAKKVLFDDLSNIYKIPTKRLRTFYIKVTNSEEFADYYYEFWLVPKKKSY